MSSALLQKLKKNSTIKYTDILEESLFIKDPVMVKTHVPMINVALSGSLQGGLTSGHTAIAGPSKHFKTSFALVMAGAYLNTYEDAILIFYDTEFGSPQGYFDQFGIDTSRVLHTPILNVEELKTELTNQLKEISREDKVIIIIDSIGNIASEKEILDALDGKNVADMTRAKALKSLFRIITPSLTISDIPLITINHTYETMEMYAKQIVSGGKGLYYSADNIWIVGRRQEKDGAEVKGYNFIINVEKSRYVKEGSKIPINVTWEKGISKYSGLIDVAVDAQIIGKKNRGRLGTSYYVMEGLNDNEPEKYFTKEEIETEDFWNMVYAETSFVKYIDNKFKI